MRITPKNCWVAQTDTLDLSISWLCCVILALVVTWEVVVRLRCAMQWRLRIPLKWLASSRAHLVRLFAFCLRIVSDELRWRWHALHCGNLFAVFTEFSLLIWFLMQACFYQRTNTRLLTFVISAFIVNSLILSVIWILYLDISTFVSYLLLVIANLFTWYHLDYHLVFSMAIARHCGALARSDPMRFTFFVGVKVLGWLLNIMIGFLRD